MCPSHMGVSLSLPRSLKIRGKIPSGGVTESAPLAGRRTAVGREVLAPAEQRSPPRARGRRGGRRQRGGNRLSTEQPLRCRRRRRRRCQRTGRSQAPGSPQREADRRGALRWARRPWKRRGVPAPPGRLLRTHGAGSARGRGAGEAAAPSSAPTRSHPRTCAHGRRSAQPGPGARRPSRERGWPRPLDGRKGRSHFPAWQTEAPVGGTDLPGAQWQDREQNPNTTSSALTRRRPLCTRRFRL